MSTATTPATILSVAFHITRQCNLRCTYCYTGAKVQAPMSRAVADAGVDCTLLEARRVGATHLDITFIGGEPLLEAELLLHIADRFRAEAGADYVLSQPIRYAVELSLYWSYF